MTRAVLPDWAYWTIILFCGMVLFLGSLQEADLEAQIRACQETRHGLEDAVEMARTQVKMSAETIAQREQDITALQEELQALRVQAAAWARRARDADDTARPLPKFSRW